MLIASKSGFMTGKRLPYDAEIEYLRFTSRSFKDVREYIDTGVVPNETFEFEIDILWNNGYNTVYGQEPISSRRVNSADADVRFMLSSYYTHGYSYCGVGPRWDYSTNQPSGVRLHYEFHNKTLATSFAGNHVFSMPENMVSMRPVYLGAANSATEGICNPFGGNIYTCKLWLNGVLVRDFIPVRKGTVGYMYDRVSGKLFGNAGTGDFVLGPDVVPVEYIESHGTEWMKTDFVPDQDSHVELSFMNLNPDTITPNIWASGAFIGSGNTQLFGVRITLGDSEIECFASPLRIHYYGQNIGIKFDAQFRNKIWTIRNVTSDVASDFTCRAPLPLCGINSGTTSGAYSVNPAFIGRIYTFRAWQGNILIRSFRPVRVGSGSTWEGAMMDVLTRRIYRNAGTGAFTYGNDLKYPIPAE